MKSIVEAIRRNNSVYNDRKFIDDHFYGKNDLQNLLKIRKILNDKRLYFKMDYKYNLPRGLTQMFCNIALGDIFDPNFYDTEDLFDGVDADNLVKRGLELIQNDLGMDYMDMDLNDEYNINIKDIENCPKSNIQHMIDEVINMCLSSIR